MNQHENLVSDIISDPLSVDNVRVLYNKLNILRFYLVIDLLNCPIFYNNILVNVSQSYTLS